ncbi:hypothetical protein C8J31_102126 [Rhizobium sp. PP-CC-2G-626]|nr:hypothetical protein C8J31_102126 [Rhizobium sp. PP-CC-2G-626]
MEGKSLKDIFEALTSITARDLAALAAIIWVTIAVSVFAPPLALILQAARAAQ